MTKNNIRRLKSHYGVRWAAFKHNRKHKNKIVPLEEKIIIKHFLPGKVLMHNCLGEMYQGFLDVTTDLEPCSTVCLINPLDFKYKTPNEIVNLMLAYKPYLLPQGKILANISLKFLIYHRLCVTHKTLSAVFAHLLCDAGFEVTSQLWPLDRISHGYGELLLICNQRE